MNRQNDKFKTVIKRCEIFNACAAIDDQPTVHTESQQVPGIKIERYILAPFPNILTFSGRHHVKKFNIVLSKVKKIRIIKKVRDTCHCW